MFLEILQKPVIVYRKDNRWICRKDGRMIPIEYVFNTVTVFGTTLIGMTRCRVRFFKTTYPAGKIVRLY